MSISWKLKKLNSNTNNRISKEIYPQTLKLWEVNECDDKVTCNRRIVMILRNLQNS